MDLTPSKQAAHRANRQQLRLNGLEEARRCRREAQRARWRLQNRRKAQRTETERGISAAIPGNDNHEASQVAWPVGANLRRQA